MPNRREFLRSITAATGAAVLEFQSEPFSGENPGAERDVDIVRLCWCPPGTFVMGSPVGETVRRADESQVAVTLTRGFWTSKYEITQGQWMRVVGAWPTKKPTAEFGEGDDFPAYWVSYDDAVRFCGKLTERVRRSNLLPGPWEFRVPTEAQWEYVCRAGTVTATSFGDQLSRDQANFKGEPLNGGRGGAALGRAARVGSYPANPWGICDMHGNVFEWCRDWYHPRLPGGTDPDLHDLKGAPNRDGTYSRVRRGGAWNDDGWFCRSALRLRYEPERSSDHIGFRVVAVQA